MKITYFHLMPYDQIPADFAEQHRSIWVDVPRSLCDSQRVNQLYNDYLDTLEYADGRGFDAIGVNEHHSSAYGQMPSPNIMSGALARRTKNAALLVMGNSLPLYNPVVRIAEELAMVDVLSGGRVIAGLPLGTSQDANFAYGIVPTDMRERYREGLGFLRRAWAADEVFSFNGKFTKLRYVNVWPRPIQRPSPPIWIPGSGSIETFDLAISEDSPYIYLSFFGANLAKDTFDRYWEKVQESGLDENPNRAGMVQFVFVADTDAEAKRLYEPHLRYFFDRLMHVYPGFLEAPGYKTSATLQAQAPPPGTVKRRRADSIPAVRRMDWSEMVDRGIIMAGSAATVRDKLIEASTANKIGNWVLLMHVGDMPKDLAKYNIDRFADGVLPYLRDIPDDFPHRWWPSAVPPTPSVYAGTGEL